MYRSYLGYLYAVANELFEPHLNWKPPYSQRYQAEISLNLPGDCTGAYAKSKQKWAKLKSDLVKSDRWTKKVCKEQL